MLSVLRIYHNILIHLTLLLSKNNITTFQNIDIFNKMLTNYCNYQYIALT